MLQNILYTVEAAITLIRSTIWTAITPNTPANATIEKKRLAIDTANVETFITAHSRLPSVYVSNLSFNNVV